MASFWGVVHLVRFFAASDLLSILMDPVKIFMYAKWVAKVVGHKFQLALAELHHLEKEVDHWNVYYFYDKITQ